MLRATGRREGLLLLCLAVLLGLLAMHSTPAAASARGPVSMSPSASMSHSAPTVSMSSSAPNSAMPMSATRPHSLSSSSTHHLASAPAYPLPSAPGHHVVQPCVSDVGRLIQLALPGVVPAMRWTEVAQLEPSQGAVRAILSTERPHLGAPDLDGLCISRT